MQSGVMPGMDQMVGMVEPPKVVSVEMAAVAVVRPWVGLEVLVECMGLQRVSQEIMEKPWERYSS